MTVICGKAGIVNGASAVGNWSITDTADTQAYVASNTNGATSRIAGNKDWSGSYKAYGHTPAYLPGADFSFVGSLDGTEGVTGAAIVDSIDIECDIEGGGIISHTVNFSGDGELALTGGIATDVTVTIPPTAIGCKVSLQTPLDSTDPAWVDETDVRNWKLTITAANQSYVSSSNSPAGTTKRCEGNWDATVSYSVYEGVLDDMPAVNTEASIRLYVTTALYWEINYVIFGEASDIQADIEGGSLVGATLNASLQAIGNMDGTTPTDGSIKTPAAATIWP